MLCSYFNPCLIFRFDNIRGVPIWSMCSDSSSSMSGSCGCLTFTHIQWNHSGFLCSQFILASLSHASFAVKNLPHFYTGTHLKLLPGAVLGINPCIGTIIQGVRGMPPQNMLISYIAAAAFLRHALKDFLYFCSVCQDEKNNLFKCKLSTQK